MCNATRRDLHSSSSAIVSVEVAVVKKRLAFRRFAISVVCERRLSANRIRPINLLGSQMCSQATRFGWKCEVALRLS